MNHLRAGPLLLLILTLVFVTDPGPDSARTTGPAEPATGPLPAGTLFAVEIRDPAGRWPDLRALPPVARFQDRLLEAAGIAPAEAPDLLGDRVLLALVAGENGRPATPLAILRPPDPTAAAARVEALFQGHGDSFRFAARVVGGALWLAPEDAIEHLVARVASGEGPPPRFHEAEIGARLPEGGIARGWIDPGAVGELLRSAGTIVPVTSLAAAELDAVRFAGFRREIDGEGVHSDGIVAYDTARLPPEVRRLLASPSPPARLPRELPAEVAAMGSFRLDGTAWLSWLRHVSRSDSRGPLRNLEFWIWELEERTGMDLDRVLAESLGDTGWFAVFEGDGRRDGRACLLLETPDPRGLEEALLAGRAWLADRIRARTLGTVVPRFAESRVDGLPAHGLMLGVPFFRGAGPWFLATERHVVVGSDTEALADGLRLLEDEPGWRTVGIPGRSGPPPAEAMRARGPVLARLAAACVQPAGETGAVLAEALDELGGSLGEIALGVWFEGDEVRLHGRLAFDRSYAEPE